MRPAPPRVNRALGVLPGGRRPRLVCGHERSGTTWVAATLGRAPGVLWYNEPANWDGDVHAFAQQAAHLPVDVASPYFESKLDPAFAGLLIERRGGR